MANLQIIAKWYYISVKTNSFMKCTKKYHTKNSLMGTNGVKRVSKKSNRYKKYLDVLQEVPALIRYQNNHCQPEPINSSQRNFLAHDNQSVLWCVIALCLSKVQPASSWSDRTIRKILHRDTVRLHRTIFNKEHVVSPNLHNIPKYVRVDKFIMEIRIFGYVLSGIVKKNRNKSKIMSLIQGFKQLFEVENVSKLILKCNKSTSAVWKTHGEYFLFQLYPSISKITGNPTASLQKHPSINSLTKAFSKKFSGIKHDSIWIIHAFAIDRIFLEKSPKKDIPQKIERKSYKLPQSNQIFKDSFPINNDLNIKIKIDKKVSQSPSSKYSWASILSSRNKKGKSSLRNVGNQYSCQNSTSNLINNTTSHIGDLENFENNHLHYGSLSGTIESLSTVDLNILSPSPSRSSKTNDIGTSAVSSTLMPSNTTVESSNGNQVSPIILNNDIIAKQEDSSERILKIHEMTIGELRYEGILDSFPNIDSKFTKAKQKFETSQNYMNPLIPLQNNHLLVKNNLSIVTLVDSSADLKINSGENNITNFISHNVDNKFDKDDANINNTNNISPMDLLPYETNNMCADNIYRNNKVIKEIISKNDLTNKNSLKQKLISSKKSVRLLSDTHVGTLNSKNVLSDSADCITVMKNTNNSKTLLPYNTFDLRVTDIIAPYRENELESLQLLDFSNSSLPTYSTDLGITLGVVERKASEEALLLHAQAAKYWLG